VAGILDAGQQHHHQPLAGLRRADIMEHIDGNNTPFGGPGTGAAPGYDWMQVFDPRNRPGRWSTVYHGNGFSAAAWHTYGMIWSKGQIQYYIDSPDQALRDLHAHYSRGWHLALRPGSAVHHPEPRRGRKLARQPGRHDSIPVAMVVDYVRIYAN
jgi:hypothetical protein